MQPISKGIFSHGSKRQRGLRGGGGGCALPLRQSKGREGNEKVLGIERVLITAAS